jgi:uncharacterized protein (DUF1800 family)
VRLPPALLALARPATAGPATAGPAAACAPAALAGCGPGARGPLRLPYAEAGLSEREAAAFLLDRFGFGPRPGDVDGLVRQGLEAWLDEQLAPSAPDPELERRLADLPSRDLPFEALRARYVQPGDVFEQAVREGLIAEGTERGSPAARQTIRRLMEERDLRPRVTLFVELAALKGLRAVYARHQLREALVDFWFNHFNVDARGAKQAAVVLDYERAAIRPHVLGRFRALLGATARHPAMLAYLDNAVSRAAPGAPTLAEPMAAGGGINENYARELMELHTLGVEGGYAQRDVEEVARAFTGWTVPPLGARARGRAFERFERAASRAERDGAPFVRDGLFLFRTDWHDAGPKEVLGRRLPAGRGVQDGEDVLDLVAAHPSTARHLARKLAQRFVTDDPDAALVEHLAATFTRSGGEIAAVVRALAEHVAFWASARSGPGGAPAKVKTPFELVASALRATGAEVGHVRGLGPFLRAMGEPVYACEPPTGFPDHELAWVNPGTLLTRMRFGVHLAANAIDGVRVDLPALLGGREPESAAAALRAFGAALLPERDLAAAYAHLTPLVGDAAFARRVDEAARAADARDGREPVMDEAEADEPMDGGEAMDGEEGETTAAARRRERQAQRGRNRRPRAAAGDAADDAGTDELYGADAPALAEADALATVAGILLGAPAFQRQ